MSTKIYEAYKIPQHKMKEFANYWFSKCKEQSKERYQRIINNIKIDWDEFLEYCENKVEDGKLDQLHAIWLFSYFLYENIFRDAALSTEKTLFDFNYGLWVFPYGEWFLIIPKVPQFMWFDLLSVDVRSAGIDYIEDFSYWDNTDKPNEIEEYVWELRGIIWDHVFQDSIKLYLNGLDLSNKIEYEFFHEEALNII